MSCCKKKTTLFALLTASAAWPAIADVTPEEVWQNWQDTSAAMGQTLIAASTARNGDALIIDTITVASAAEGVTVEGSIAQISMLDQGDGTVLVTMSPEYPVKMRLPGMQAGEPEVELNILVTQRDLRMIASGDSAAISYDLTAPSIKIKLERMEGPAGQTANLIVDATMTDIAGTYTTKKDGEDISADSDVTAQGLALAIIGYEPAAQSELRATAAMTGLSVKTTGALLNAALGAGANPEMLADVETSSALRTQTTQFDLESVDPQGTTSVKGTMGEGAMEANFSGGMMDYSGSQKAVALTVNAPTIPVPDVALSLDEYTFALKTPVAPSDMVQPFAFSTNMVNLALSDQIWALFDPTASLPRDPINLTIDTEGTAKLNAVSDDPAAAPLLPADLQTLNLKALKLSVAGAELSGAGTSTFEPIEGALPSPNAKLDFKLTGANGLMDKLVASGLIVPQMLTMPRMLLAMVASPAADGSDSYDSTIEIKDKSVSANGQILYQLP